MDSFDIDRFRTSSEEMDEDETLADLDGLVSVWTATAVLAFSTFAERDFALIESRRTAWLESSPALCAVEVCPAHETRNLLPVQYLDTIRGTLAYDSRSFT